MKITFDVDCTPEEARRLVGLPDLSPIHEIYLSRFKEVMSNGLAPDMAEAMMRGWAPMGDAGLAAWRLMVEKMTTPIG